MSAGNRYIVYGNVAIGESGHITSAQFAHILNSIKQEHFSNERERKGGKKKRSLVQQILSSIRTFRRKGFHGDALTYTSGTKRSLSSLTQTYTSQCLALTTNTGVSQTRTRARSLFLRVGDRPWVQD